MSMLNRRRRPPPIRIPPLEQRDNVQGTPSPKTPPPRTPEAPESTSLGTRTLSQAQGSTTAQCATGTDFSCAITSRTTRSETLPTTALTLATTTTRPQSPTRTTFVTVIQSIQSPKEKQETPNPAQTVFITTPAAVVTVTAAPTIPAPVATETGIPTDSKQQGLNALPAGAKVPIIVLSVIAGITGLLMAAIVIWKKRKREKEERNATEQGDMAEVNESSFRAVPDTRPILSQNQ